MTGLFGTLNIGTKGMTASQTSLQATSHNISNMNTEGYSRQRVTLQADTPNTIAGVGQVGTGVRMTSVVRVADDYVTQQLREENGSLQRYEVKADILGQMETIFNEPSQTGLSNGFSQFYASWNNLSSNPENATAKTMVMQRSQTLTDTMRHTANQLDGLRQDTIHTVHVSVQQFNTKVEQLDTLNKQIFNVMTKGQTPNDLLDQRDQLTKELGSLASVEVSYDSFQRALVKLDGQSVVEEGGFQKLAAVVDQDANGQAVLSGGKPVTADGPLTEGQIVLEGKDGKQTALKVTSGTILGAQEALGVIDGKLGELDSLAATFADAVNQIHSNNGEGIAFFTYEKGNAASSLTVNEAIISQPAKINAGASLSKPISGDGKRAGAIAALANTRLDYSGEAGLPEYDAAAMSFDHEPGGNTTTGSYNDMLTNLGILKQQADYMTASQSEVLSFLEERRDSLSGVSLNEEVVDMMKFQTAFQANARIISVVDEMLDTLINRTGR